MSSGGQQPVTQQTQQTQRPMVAPRKPHLQQSMNIARGLHCQRHWLSALDRRDAGRLTVLIRRLQSGRTTHRLISIISLWAARPASMPRAISAPMTIKDQGLQPGITLAVRAGAGRSKSVPANRCSTPAIGRSATRSVPSMSGAGRYGSGQHTDVAARAMAEAADPVLAQDYARRQQQMQSIAGGGQQGAGQWSAIDADAWMQRNLHQRKGWMTSGNIIKSGRRADSTIRSRLYNAQQARPWEQVARYNAIAGQRGGP